MILTFFKNFLAKANKIANSDGDNSSKIYGNALLGPNLWDKNDLFQGEKLGVKFEYLDIDEFLNENGLNEADVEFLDQLQNNGSNPNKPNQTLLYSYNLTLSLSSPPKRYHFQSCNTIKHPNRIVQIDETVQITAIQDIIPLVTRETDPEQRLPCVQKEL